MSNIIVSPSILSADFAYLQRDIERVEKAGANWLHIDVMDGHFVPNISIGIPVVKSVKRVTKIPLDVHLMIENPIDYIPKFIDAGADIVTVHQEACSDMLEVVLEYIKARGVKSGVAIKPNTPANVLNDYLDKMDMALVMTVEPGFSGQKFIEEAAYKVEYIKNRVSDEFIIQVDGGINDKTANVCKYLGANSLVAGDYIYKSVDIQAAIDSLR